MHYFSFFTTISEFYFLHRYPFFLYNRRWVFIFSSSDVHLFSQTSASFYLFFTDINECQEVGKGGCQHQCFNTMGSYYCSCYSGYRLHYDRRQCTQSQRCNSCNSCPPGFHMNTQSRRCEGKNASGLLWTTQPPVSLHDSIWIHSLDDVKVRVCPSPIPLGFSGYPWIPSPQFPLQDSIWIHSLDDVKVRVCPSPIPLGFSGYPLDTPWIPSPQFPSMIPYEYTVWTMWRYEYMSPSITSGLLWIPLDTPVPRFPSRIPYEYTVWTMWRYEYMSPSITSGLLWIPLDTPVPRFPSRIPYEYTVWTMWRYEYVPLQYLWTPLDTQPPDCLHDSVWIHSLDDVKVRICPTQVPMDTWITTTLPLRASLCLENSVCIAKGVTHINTDWIMVSL